jgi:hypothetical protein
VDWFRSNSGREVHSSDPRTHQWFPFRNRRRYRNCLLPQTPESPFRLARLRRTEIAAAASAARNSAWHHWPRLSGLVQQQITQPVRHRSPEPINARPQRLTGLRLEDTLYRSRTNYRSGRSRLVGSRPRNSPAEREQRSKALLAQVDSRPGDHAGRQRDQDRIRISDADIGGDGAA